MTYKTILVHVDHGRHAQQRIALAAELACAADAHLVGVAMVCISRYVYLGSSVDLDTTIVASQPPDSPVRPPTLIARDLASQPSSRTAASTPAES